MKKIFLILSIALIALCASAQTKTINNRLAIRSIMDFATTTKVYASNRDSGVIVEKIGVDSISNKGEIAIIFRIRVITDTSRFSNIQNQLLQEAISQQVSAKQLQIQATSTIADAKNIEADLKTDIANRPKITVQGIVPNSYNEVVKPKIQTDVDPSPEVKPAAKPQKKKKRFFDFLKRKK